MDSNLQAFSKMNSERLSVFVFGSNLNGWHGKRAAAWAKRHFGAIQGHGVGRQGRSYAIPTKGYKMETLPLDRIQAYVTTFIDHAREQVNTDFHVSAIGCGLAGYSEWQIAPMFKEAPHCCKLPLGWRSFSQLKDQNPRAFDMCVAKELDAQLQYERLLREGLSESFEQLQLGVWPPHAGPKE